MLDSGVAVLDVDAPATLEHAIVGSDATILETMRSIDRSGLEVALVCSEDRRLVAVATDGDIRRGLLRGVSLDAPVSVVANSNFSAVAPGIDRVEAIQTLLQKGIACLPVVDAQGRLVNLFTFHGALVSQRVPSWALIMAGGRGERLGELTQALPKPMLPIGDRPILERLVQLLVSHGIARIFISINYLGSMIVDHFGDGKRFHCRIEYLREEEPLGTGGPVALLPQPPSDPLLVLNGDLLTNINVTRLLAFHQTGAHAATMALREYRVEVPFGVAELSGARVTRLVEKPSLLHHINAGVYVLDPAVCARVPHGRYLPITDLLKSCLEDGLPVGAFLIQESWGDIGLPEEYLRVHSGSTDR
jgi:dTDP-glucose pyrophosphorylase